MIFFEARADTKAKDGAGYTPLLRAVLYGKHAVIRALVEARADLDAGRSSGTLLIAGGVAASRLTAGRVTGRTNVTAGLLREICDVAAAMGNQ